MLPNGYNVIQQISGNKTCYAIHQIAIYQVDSINPLSPTSDQERISPYTISTISSRQVMRIKKNIN